MRPGLVLILLLAILCCAASLWAQQRQPVMPPAAIPNAPAAVPAWPSQGAPGPSIAVQRPPLSYTPMPAPVETRPDESDFPRYPYPPFPNPYYDANMNRNVLNEGVDWLWALSSQLAGRVSNFVDIGMFPGRPATHGGTTQSNSGGQGQTPVTGIQPVGGQ